jgi:hypothetical protein
MPRGVPVASLKARQSTREEIFMSSPSDHLPTSEGPGSVSGAPGVAAGFTDTFAPRAAAAS